MSNNNAVEKLYCAKFTLVFDDRRIDNCAFISASSAQEAWDLTEALASVWNSKEKDWDLFRIQKVFKQPCPGKPAMIWSKRILGNVKQQGRIAVFS
jgi:hypothetical protein